MGKRAKPEEVIANLRAIEVRLGPGETAAQAARATGVTEQTYYGWRKEYGGLPGHIHSDNGPEFIAMALRQWLHLLKVKIL